MEQPEVPRLSFDERLARLVDRERTYRESRPQSRLLQLARLRQSACVVCIRQSSLRQGLSARYQRTPRLLDTLRIARGDGGYHKKLALLARTDLLILDDFGLKPLPQQERHDLLELIEDQHGLRSTLITSQLPISVWHEYLNDPTVADARLDRLTSGAHRLELKGESRRKRNANLTKTEAQR